MFIAALTRAEFKHPFTTSFEVEMKHAENQNPLHLLFGICTPDPRDGYLMDSNLYGKVAVILEANSDDGMGHTYCWNFVGDEGSSVSANGAWEPDKRYRIDITQAANQGLLDYHVTVTDIDADTVVYEGNLFGEHNSRCRTFRCMLAAMTTEQNEAYTELYVDEFKVTRPASKKARCAVSIIHGLESPEIIMATDDVVDVQVTEREGSYPSARVTLKNRSLAYNNLSVIDEIEIRAGWDHMLWLLFRGNIDTPEKAFPPAEANISSNKGFARRLDFLETDGESFYGDLSGTIVKSLLTEYFAGVFGPDWISDGIATSLDSDDEMVGSVVQKLAEMNGFIVYVDFNRAVHFVDPENEESQSNLKLETAKDVLQITNRLVDEIINEVTVKGATDTYTSGDLSSQGQYWKRQRTFKDPNLTSLGAVQARAEELLKASKDPYQEIPITLPELFILELYDKVTVTCEQVGLENEEINLRQVTYGYQNGGLSTKITALHKGFSIAELLAEHSRKLSGVT